MERRKNTVKMKPLTVYFQNTGLDSHREEDEGDNGRDLNEDKSDEEHPDRIHEEDGPNVVRGDFRPRIAKRIRPETVCRCEDLMRISLEGPPLESYDPSAAVERWLSSKRAR
ncbi:hypothetical protein ABVT39_012835 [Epinephelus coioides]